MAAPKVRTDDRGLAGPVTGSLSTPVRDGASPPTRLRRRGSLGAQRNRLFWPFIAPALAFYAVLMLAPTVGTIWISLNSWRAQGDPMVFVGPGNYLNLLTDSSFLTAFWNTLKILVICGIVIFVLAFGMTMALREMRGRRFAQAMLFFPYIISPIVVAIGLGLFLDPNGALNAALRGAGLASLATEWLSPQHIFITLVVTIIWVSTGFFVLLIMAGVDRIPPYFYEDSELAGASSWQKFIHVTLPLSFDVVTIAAVLWVINAFKIFELIIAFTSVGGAPPVEARTLAVQQYYVTIGSRFPVYAMGQGSAIGIVTLLLVAVCVVIVRRLMRRERVEF